MSIKNQKYDESYLQYGFTSIVVNNEERPQCVLCNKVLSNGTCIMSTRITKIKKKPILNDKAEL